MGQEKGNSWAVVVANDACGELTTAADPRTKDPEARLQEAQEHEDKLQEIMESVPSRVYNVMGSNAGAGSGDFHQYRQARRREQMRLLRMEADHKKLKLKRDFEERQAARLAAIEERTAKNRAKRQKKKEKKKLSKIAKRSDSASGAPGSADREAAGKGESEDEAVEQPDLD